MKIRCLAGCVFVTLSCSFEKKQEFKSSISNIGFANVCDFDKVPNSENINFKGKAKSIVKIFDQTRRGEATGFVINNDGYVITNRHVVTECFKNVGPISRDFKTYCRNLKAEIILDTQCFQSKPRFVTKTFQDVELIWPKTDLENRDLHQDIAVLRISNFEEKKFNFSSLKFSKQELKIEDPVFVMGFPIPKILEISYFSNKLKELQQHERVSKLLAEGYAKSLKQKSMFPIFETIEKNNLLPVMVNWANRDFSQAESSVLRSLSYYQSNPKWISEMESFLATQNIVHRLTATKVKREILFIEEMLKSSSPFALRNTDSTLRLSYGKRVGDLQIDPLPTFTTNEMEKFAAVIRTRNLAPIAGDEGLIAKLLEFYSGHAEDDVLAIHQRSYALMAMCGNMNSESAQNKLNYCNSVLLRDPMFGNTIINFSRRLARSKSKKAIFINAEIAPGSSGSPVLNVDGNVQAMVTGIATNNVFDTKRRGGWDSSSRAVSLDAKAVIDVLRQINRERNISHEDLIDYDLK